MARYYRGWNNDQYVDFGSGQDPTQVASANLNASMDRNAQQQDALAAYSALQGQQQQANAQQVKMQQLGQSAAERMAAFQAQQSQQSQTNAQDFQAQQAALNRQAQAQQSGQQEFGNLLIEGGRQYEQEAGRAQQHQQFEEGRSDEWGMLNARQNFQADQSQFEADNQNARLGATLANENQNLDTRQNFQAAQDVYQHGASIDEMQKRAETQAWLNQRQMTQAETMRMQRLDNEVGAVWANPNLSDDERWNLTTILKSQLDPLKQRFEMTKAARLDEQTQFQMRQEAEKFRIGQMNAQQLAQEMKNHSYTDEAGNTFMADPLGGKIIHIPAKAAGKGGTESKPFDVKTARAQSVSEGDLQLGHLGKTDAHLFAGLPASDQQAFLDKYGGGSDKVAAANGWAAESDQNIANQRSVVERQAFMRHLDAHNLQNPDNAEYPGRFDPQFHAMFASKYGADNAEAGWQAEHQQRIGAMRQQQLQAGRGGQPTGPAVIQPRSWSQPSNRPDSIQFDQINAQRTAAGLPPFNSIDEAESAINTMRQRAGASSATQSGPRTAPVAAQAPRPTMAQRLPGVMNQIDNAMEVDGSTQHPGSSQYIQQNGNLLKDVMGRYSSFADMPDDLKGKVIDAMSTMGAPRFMPPDVQAVYYQLLKTRNEQARAANARR